MCRQALKKSSGEMRIFVGRIEKFPHDGRLLLVNVVLYDKAGNEIEDYVQHVNIKKLPFKGKNYKVGDVVRFTGRPFMYSRGNKTCDYAITPGTNNRRLKPVELQRYNEYLNNRRRDKKASPFFVIFIF